MNWFQYIERFDEPFRSMVLEVGLRYELLRVLERDKFLELLHRRGRQLRRRSRSS